MQVLCALISQDPAKQRWLHLAGMVPLLQRLTLQRSLDTLGDGNLPSLMAEPSALGLQRQSARMLALLASDTAAQPAISRSAWVRSGRPHDGNECIIIMVHFGIYYDGTSS